MRPKSPKRGVRSAPLAMTPTVLAALTYGGKCEEMGRLKALAMLRKDRKMWVAYYAAKKEAERLLRVVAAKSTPMETSS